MKRRNFLYLGGAGMASAAVTASMPVWAKTALKSINRALNPALLRTDEIVYGVDSQGNLFWKYPGQAWNLLKIQLDNVVIDISNPAISWIDDSVVPGGPNTLIWDYGAGGGSFPGVMDKMVDILDSQAYQGISLMMSSIGATLAGVEASAVALKISDSMPSFLGIAGRAITIVGVGENIYQMTQEGFNWTDGIQTAVGFVLIGVAFANPVGAGVATAVLIAELGLFIWELAENEY